MRKSNKEVTGGIKTVKWGKCKTCQQHLLITKELRFDGWTRWTCADGHINEKRGWKL
jgi:hypothetical protein